MLEIRYIQEIFTQETELDHMKKRYWTYNCIVQQIIKFVK